MGAPNQEAASTVPLRELFWGFCLIGVSGFGGVMPWARRYIVERYRWLPPDEFAAMLGLCQIMPGPNVMNLSICVGNKFQGWRGAMVAPLGMMLAPMLIVLVLGLAYLHYGELPMVRSVLHGISAVGAGLIIATGLKMLVAYRQRKIALLIAALTLGLFGGLQLPLVQVVAILLPLGIVMSLLGKKCLP